MARVSEEIRELWCEGVKEQGFTLPEWYAIQRGLV